MPPPFATSTQTLFSPAELSFLHSSLSLIPPIRPDLRTATQFRPLVAETDIFPNTNGSARICFSDGTEAIVGVKADIEKTTGTAAAGARQSDTATEIETAHPSHTSKQISASWLTLSIDIPGHRDDDNLPVFLGSMISETLLAESTLTSTLYINSRWHWHLYIDVLLLSPPLSYPLPLLSLTTHLALLDARLPRLISETEDDPIFDDDWDAAVSLYPREAKGGARPTVTLLAMTVAENVIFDPSREELAVADAVLALSVLPIPSSQNSSSATSSVKLLAIRTIDPPSRMTPPGVPNAMNPHVAGNTVADQAIGSVGGPGNPMQEMLPLSEKQNLWQPPRGGIKRDLIARIVKMVVEKGGVGEEVVAGLADVTT